MSPRLNGWIVAVLLVGTLAYALAEDLTLTTYYPSPRGVYQSLRTTDLRATEMVAIGGQRPTDTSAQLIPHRLVVAGAPATNPTEVGGVTGPCPAGTAWYDEDADLSLDNQECRPPGLLVTTAGQVGIGTTSPTASAAVEISSVTQGLLPPRMTTSQRDAILTPAEGLVVYNTDTNQLEACGSVVWPCGGTPPPPPPPPSAHGMEVFTSPGSNTFLIPPDVSSIQIEAWGAGAGGSYANSYMSGGVLVACGGGGGGGGGYGKRVVAVTPDVASYPITVTVGAGGQGGIAQGEWAATAGGSSTVASQAFGTVLATGGSTESGVIYGGRGGGSSEYMSVSGQWGENAACISQNIPPKGGSGGSGGNGGTGGRGGAPQNAGANGDAPGGGGGGGGAHPSVVSGYDGGDGAPGRVAITW